MPPRINDELADLLAAVLNNRCPGLKALHGGRFQPLTRAEREQVVDALSAELCEHELQEDGEPTRRGVLLDRLISYFVPFDLPMHPTRGTE